MIDSFARLFPTWYRLPPRERGYQQHVIVNWLEIEIEPTQAHAHTERASQLA
jgi:hypothetical protein